MGEFTALELINTVCDRIGLARTSSILSDEPQVRSLLSFLHETGDEIAKARDWPELTAEFIIEISTPIVLTASCTAGDAIVTVSSSAIISAAGAALWSVTGDNVQIGCRVASVINATTIELTETVDATQVADITFTIDTFDLPEDYKRDIPQTAWDRRNQWELLGPDGPQVDQTLRSGIIPTGPRRRMRMIGYPRRARIWPPPSAAGDTPGTLVREYVSKYWIADSSGTRQRFFTANDDVHVWDEDDMLIQGTRWRYLQSKGLAFDDYRASYYEKIEAGSGAATGAPSLSLGRGQQSYLISSANIQDGNFPDRTGID